MLKPDRFSCSQKVWLKWDPPVAACPGKPSALTMYYTANIAFMNYFDNLIEQSGIEKLDMHISQNWTTEQQVFPIALQTSEFDTKLLQAPKTLKDLVRQH